MPEPLDDLSVSPDDELGAERNALLAALNQRVAQTNSESRFLWTWFVGASVDQLGLSEDELASFSQEDFDTLATEIVSSAGDAATQVPAAQTLTTIVLKSIATQGRVLFQPTRSGIFLKADPVMMFSGQFVLDTTDLEIEGAGIAFAFHRVYKSGVGYRGPLGHNWDHDYNKSLSDNGDVILFSNGALAQEMFLRHPKFGLRGFNYWVPPDGRHDVLTQAGQSFVLRAPDGARDFFETTPGRPGEYRLARTEDRHGNCLTFAYRTQGDDRLGEIALNHPDRKITLDYDQEGHLLSLADYAGRVWRYAYDAFGDLTDVFGPATPDHPEGLVAHYEYSSAQVSQKSAHNLLRVYDPAGRLWLENEYGADAGLFSFNRVVSQRQGKGAAFFEYARVDPVLDRDYSDVERPIVLTDHVDRSGARCRYVFNHFGHLLRKDEQLVDGGTIRTLSSLFRYNADGALVSSCTPEGRIVQHFYGRDYFQRRHNVTDEQTPIHDLLSDRERRAFGNLLATVQRAQLLGPQNLPANGVWGDNFPDVLTTGPGDIIVKFTYEPNFNQLLTSSDPRFTRSVDPSHHDQPGEHPRYRQTLRSYRYTAPAGANYPVPQGTPHADSAALYLTHVIDPATTDPSGNIVPALPAQFLRYDPAGRIIEQIDRRGTSTIYEYFAASQGLRSGYLRRRTVDPQGLQLVYDQEVDIVGRVVAESSPRALTEASSSFRSTRAFDDYDRMIEETSCPPFSVRRSYRYDPCGKLARTDSELRGENGQPLHGGLRVEETVFDVMGNPVRLSVRDATGAASLATRNFYDDADRLARQVLPRGNEIWTTHDTRGLKTAVVWAACTPDETRTRFRYDDDGLQTAAIDGNGNVTTTRRDASGHVVEVTDTLGNMHLVTYDKAGNRTIERTFGKLYDGTYVLLRRGEAVFDQCNRRIIRRENLFTQPPASTRPATDNLVSPGPGRVVETCWYYDQKGDLVRVVDSTGEETHYAYDAAGRLVEEVDATGNKRVLSYDANGNCTRVDMLDLLPTAAGSSAPTYETFSMLHEFDALDRLVCATDALGNQHRLVYDTLDNVTVEQDPLGNVVRNSYDVFGNLTSIVHEVSPTGLGGDGPPLNVAKTFVYDANGNCIETIDARGLRRQTEFDALDRRVVARLPDGSEERWEYDKANNVRRHTLADGQHIVSRYDGLNRLIKSELVSPPAGGGGGTFFEIMDYDGLGRVIKEESNIARIERSFDSLSRPVRETFTHLGTGVTGSTAQYAVNRTFDDAGRVTLLQYPNGREVGFRRDPLGRTIEIENQAPGSPRAGSAAFSGAYSIARLAYRGRRLGSYRFGNGAQVTRAFDPGGRPLALRHLDAAGAPFLHLQYLFDGADNLRVANRETQGVLQDTFRYNSRYWLTKTSRNAGATFAVAALAPAQALLAPSALDGQRRIDAMIGSLADDQQNPTWRYDESGNRRTEQLSATTIQYVVNSLDEYTSVGSRALQYDGRGNLVDDGTYRFAYDMHDQLIGVMRLADGAQMAAFSYDTIGRCIESVTSDGVRDLVWDGDNTIAEYLSGQLAAEFVHAGARNSPVQMCVGGHDYWCHRDVFVSCCALSDETGGAAALYEYGAFGEPIGLAGPYNPFLHHAQRYYADIAVYGYQARAFSPALGRFLQRDPLDADHSYLFLENNPFSGNDPIGLERELLQQIEREENQTFLRGLDELVWSGDGRVRTRWEDMQWHSRMDFERQLAQGDVIRSSFVGAMAWVSLRHFIDDPEKLLAVTEIFATLPAVVNPRGGGGASARGGARGARGGGGSKRSRLNNSSMTIKLDAPTRRIVERAAELYRDEMARLKSKIPDAARRSVEAHKSAQKKLVSEFGERVEIEPSTGMTAPGMKRGDVAAWAKTKRAAMVEFKSTSFVRVKDPETGKITRELVVKGMETKAPGQTSQIDSLEALHREMGLPVIVTNERGEMFSPAPKSGWRRVDTRARRR